jgi:hypothetical protein
MHVKHHFGAKTISSEACSSQTPVDGREFSAVIGSDRRCLAMNPAEATLIRFQFKFLIHECEELMPVIVVEKASECTQALEEFSPSAQ